MIIITYRSTVDMIYILQSLISKTKIKINQNLNKYYDEMNYRRQSGTFQFEEDLFAKNAQGISETYNE